MTRLHRVALLAHGHPALSPGGAELAAHTLFQALRQRDDVEALLVACVPEGHALAGGECEPGVRFVPLQAIDPFRLLSRDPAEPRAVLAALEHFRPDTIHLHHVLGFGADLLFALRRAFPRAALVLTLHEYQPICRQDGQMVRPGTMELCDRSSPARCAGCFPQHTPERFLSRAATLRALFSLVDRFLAPSAFLAARYRDWGLPAERITCLENAVEALPRLRPRRAGPAGRMRGRFAFFGQINPYKGVDLLLEAVARLHARGEWEGCELAIHGANLERQREDFQAEIARLLADAPPGVTLHGAYSRDALPRLMAEADWVVVPSRWWENSPLVVQEAFGAGRPVIGAALGGLAEKLTAERDALLFAPGDPQSLAETLMRARDPKLWRRLRGGIRPSEPPAEAARQHLALYRSLAVPAPVAEPV
ncbi:glycosyltransferase family 4 protein [Aureimonas sp. AU40]|uniref:glycosyltransferase family 4 protein n=1 Tax=Aureimonas sp. AU40 TaxID=1637747 RepID=UPI00078275E9|nr:glycosyltransferase family 4 protein [Aureimonas sp. AU40]